MCLIKLIFFIISYCKQSYLILIHFEYYKVVCVLGISVIWKTQPLWEAKREGLVEILSDWINMYMAFPDFTLGSRHLKIDPTETYAFSQFVYSQLLSFQLKAWYLHACWHTWAEAHTQTHMHVCVYL